MVRRRRSAVLAQALEPRRLFTFLDLDESFSDDGVAVAGGAAGSLDDAELVALDDGGSVVASPRRAVFFDADGAVRRRVDLAGSVDVAIDPATGRVLALTGRTGFGAGESYLVRLYDGGAVRTFDVQGAFDELGDAPEPPIPQAVAFDPGGGFFVAYGNGTGSFGEVEGNARFPRFFAAEVYVARFDATGAVDRAYGGGDGLAELAGTAALAALDADPDRVIAERGWRVEDFHVDASRRALVLLQDQRFAVERTALANDTGYVVTYVRALGFAAAQQGGAVPAQSPRLADGQGAEQGEGAPLNDRVVDVAWDRADGSFVALRDQTGRGFRTDVRFIGADLQETDSAEVAGGSRVEFVGVGVARAADGSVVVRARTASATPVLWGYDPAGGENRTTLVSVDPIDGDTRYRRGTSRLRGGEIAVDAQGRALLLGAELGENSRVLATRLDAPTVDLRARPGRATLLADGTLLIEGTDAADEIDVDLVSGRRVVRVAVNGAVRRFDNAAVRGFVVNGNAGDDDVDLPGNTQRGAFVRGGAGADAVSGTGGADVIRGDAGAHRLDGDYGDDVLIGGEGDDELVGSFGADTLLGAFGDDALYAFTAASRADGARDVLDGSGGDDFLAGLAGEDASAYGFDG